MIGLSTSTCRRRLVWAAMVVCLAAPGAPPARADGGVVEGTFTLLLSGDTAEKIDLVFLGDGFTSAQQDAFNARVDEAVAAFMNAHPLQALRSAFNIHRVNVSSPESGTDKFAKCGDADTGDSDVSRRTAMDSGYCNGGTGTIYRCMGSSNHSLAQGFAANAPDDDIVIVLVNDGGHGGCAFGGLTYFTLTSSFADIVVHELGHAVFGLADEYRYDGDDTYTGPEPGSANVTANTDRTTLKWRDLVLPVHGHPDAEPGAELRRRRRASGPQRRRGPGGHVRVGRDQALRHLPSPARLPHAGERSAVLFGVPARHHPPPRQQAERRSLGVLRQPPDPRRPRRLGARKRRHLLQLRPERERPAGFRAMAVQRGLGVRRRRLEEHQRVRGDDPGARGGHGGVARPEGARRRLAGRRRRSRQRRHRGAAGRRRLQRGPERLPAERDGAGRRASRAARSAQHQGRPGELSRRATATSSSSSRSRTAARASRDDGRPRGRTAWAITTART